jgi:hypothetical protein
VKTNPLGFHETFATSSVPLSIILILIYFLAAHRVLRKPMDKVSAICKENLTYKLGECPQRTLGVID